LAEGFVGAMSRNIAAKLLQAGTELERGAKEELGPGLGEVLLIQQGIDAREALRKLVEFLLNGREVLFLEGFELEAFHDFDLAAVLVLPAPEGGTRDLQAFGDFADAPAIGAQEKESSVRFGGVHMVFLF